MALPMWKCPDFSPRNVTEGNLSSLVEWTDDERAVEWKSRMLEVSIGEIRERILFLFISNGLNITFVCGLVHNT